MKKVILIGSIILLVVSCTSEPTSAHKKRNSPEEKVALQHHIDSLEEVFENKEQIEVSKFYEKLPKPHALAVEEWLNDKIYYRNTEKDA